MIVRIWRTEIEPTRATDYLEFARHYSLPMFREQRGFGGVLFAAGGAERAVITLWQDMAAVEALAESDTYARTVEAIEAAGFLRGEAEVAVLEVEHSHLEASIVALDEDTSVLRGCDDD